MKRFMILVSIALLFVVSIVLVIFAADSNGVVGNLISSLFEKWFGINSGVGATLFTAVLALIGVGVRVILKKIPGGPEGFFGKIIWSILAFLFGSGVRTEGSTDTEMVKNELRKRYPLLNIEVKSPPPLSK